DLGDHGELVAREVADVARRGQQTAQERLLLTVGKARHLGAEDVERLVADAQGDLAGQVEYPAAAAQLTVQAELAAVKLIVRAEEIGNYRLGPGLQDRHIGDRLERNHVFLDLQPIAQVEVTEAAQQVQPVVAAAEQLGPQVGFRAPELAREVDRDAARQRYGVRTRGVAGRRGNFPPLGIEVLDDHRAGDHRVDVRGQGEAVRLTFEEEETALDAAQLAGIEPPA